MNLIRIGIIGLFVLQSSLCSSQENWELAQDKDEIFIYTRTEENSSFKSFKVNLEIECTIERFIYEIQNLDGFKKWGYKIREVELLERAGDTIQIYYAESKAPFPFKNRDGIYKNTFRWDKESQTLLIPIDVLDNRLPLKEGKIRVKGKGYWKVIVNDKGKLDITFEMSIDPGGAIPAWLSNIFITDSPYSTINDLKEILEVPLKNNINYSFLD